MKPETKLEAWFGARVRDAGGLTYKCVPLVAGTPDRMVLLAGRVHLIELKTDTGELSERQKVWHERALTRTGVQVAVLHGRAEVDVWLRANQ